MRLIVISLVGLVSIGIYEYFSSNKEIIQSNTQSNTQYTNRPITQYAGKKQRKKNKTKKKNKYKK